MPRTIFDSVRRIKPKEQGFWQRYPNLRRGLIYAGVLSVLPSFSLNFVGTKIQGEHPLDPERKFTVTLSKDFAGKLDSLSRKFGVPKEMATYALSLSDTSLQKFLVETRERQDRAGGSGYFQYNDERLLMPVERMKEIRNLPALMQDVSRANNIEMHFLQGALRSQRKLGMEEPVK